MSRFFRTLGFHATAAPWFCSANNAIMFTYRLVDHCVPAMWHQNAKTPPKWRAETFFNINDLLGLGGPQPPISAVSFSDPSLRLGYNDKRYSNENLDQ